MFPIPGQLHAYFWVGLAIVVSLVPVGVNHNALALQIPHGDG